MDVSPKTVREVEFREKLRGYHPEDVDQFLERVAKGIEILQERLRAATERAVRAERTAAESAGSDDTLRRTLVLAQRTADAAVQEAHEQASHVISESEAKARQLIADAEATVARMIEEAEGSLRAEVIKLGEDVETLQADVAALTHWIDEHRSFLTSALSTAVEGLQNDLQLLRDPPVASAVDVVPAPTAADVSGAASPAEEPSAPLAASEAPPAAGGRVPGNGLPANGAPSNGTPTNGTASNGTAAHEANGSPLPDATDADGGELWTAQDHRSGQEEAVAAAQFYAELRDAVEDPQPLGPRESEPINRPDPAPRDFGLFDDDDDDDLAASRRFGSRLRRRR